MLKISFALISIIFLIPVTIFAGIFDDSDELIGKTVVAIGDIEKLDCPSYGKYDCLKWPSNFYKLTSQYKEICFTADLFNCSLKCKGLIAVDKMGVDYLFYIESSLSSVNFKKHFFQKYNCPSDY